MDFNYKDNYILENDFVLLRPLQMEDKELLIDYSVNEPEIWRYNINGGNGLANYETYINTAIALRESEKQYPFIVFNKQTNEYAGMTRYYEISNEFKRLEIGYTWYGKKHQGTGLNKNCKYLLLSFAFEKLGMIRVGFGANIHNERSIRAMKSIGCKEEGVMRHYTRDADGNIIDRIVLSILKEEWDAGVKEQLKNKISQ